MKLFRLDNHTLVISEEALTIKVFRQIWSRDKSKHKEKAIMELGFLYHFCDPRSTYAYKIDEEERMEDIKSALGLDKKWKPDDLVKQGILVYRSLTHTTSSLLLEDVRHAVEVLRGEFRDLDMKETDDKGRRIYKFNDITTAVAKVPDLVKKLQDAEKAINSEIMENSLMRGQREKKIFEDGLV